MTPMVFDDDDAAADDDDDDDDDDEDDFIFSLFLGMVIGSRISGWWGPVPENPPSGTAKTNGQRSPICLGFRDIYDIYVAGIAIHFMLRDLGRFVVWEQLVSRIISCFGYGKFGCGKPGLESLESPIQFMQNGVNGQKLLWIDQSLGCTW